LVLELGEDIAALNLDSAENDAGIDLQRLQSSIVN
jgi:hypothetical protein